jgi:hypothetical protein
LIHSVYNLQSFAFKLFFSHQISMSYKFWTVDNNKIIGKSSQNSIINIYLFVIRLLQQAIASVVFYASMVAQFSATNCYEHLSSLQKHV